MHTSASLFTDRGSRATQLEVLRENERLRAVGGVVVVFSWVQVLERGLALVWEPDKVQLCCVTLDLVGRLAGSLACQRERKREFKLLQIVHCVVCQ